jgi:hypothetical protein
MTRRTTKRDESGAALILALIFMVITGITVTALLTYGDASLLNTPVYLSVQTREAAANAATNIAVQTVRYSDPSLGSGYCPPFTNLGIAIPEGPQNVYMWVTCTADPGGLTQNGNGTRTIDYFTCAAKGPCNAGNALVSAEVESVDGVTCNSSAVASCGQQIRVLGWTNAKM